MSGPSASEKREARKLLGGLVFCLCLCLIGCNRASEVHGGFYVKSWYGVPLDNVGRRIFLVRAEFLPKIYEAEQTALNLAEKDKQQRKQNLNEQFRKAEEMGLLSSRGKSWGASEEKLYEEMAHGMDVLGGWEVAIANALEGQKSKYQLVATDIEGKYSFGNIPKGRYAVVVWVNEHVLSKGTYGYWIIPVEVKGDGKPIKIDISQSNARLFLYGTFEP